MTNHVTLKQFLKQLDAAEGMVASLIDCSCFAISLFFIDDVEREVHVETVEKLEALFIGKLSSGIAPSFICFPDGSMRNKLNVNS